MKCPKCGYDNLDDVAECDECGINLAWAAQNLTENCPTCGNPNPARALKCATCGLDLERERERQEQQEQATRDEKAREAATRVSVQMRDTETKRVLQKEQGRKAAMNALISAIVGIFVCAIIFGPYSLHKASEAHDLLQPGDPGKGMATAAQIIAALSLLLWVFGILLTVCGALSESGSY